MEKRYVPALGEIAITVGLICTLILIYRFIVIYVPILPKEHEAPSHSGGGGH
jgi:Ni/Fe-hydrogenase subunit HybB-like protein